MRFQYTQRCWDSFPHVEAAVIVAEKQDCSVTQGRGTISDSRFPLTGTEESENTRGVQAVLTACSGFANSNCSSITAIDVSQVSGDLRTDVLPQDSVLSGPGGPPGDRVFVDTAGKIHARRQPGKTGLCTDISTPISKLILVVESHSGDHQFAMWTRDLCYVVAESWRATSVLFMLTVERPAAYA